MMEPTESRLRESSCRPGPLRSFAAILRDAWLAFRDARILWLLLAAIVVLFAMALSARVEPLSAGRRYLDLAARAHHAHRVQTARHAHLARESHPPRP